MRPLAAQYGVTAREIGRVTRSEFRIQLNGRMLVSAGVSSLTEIWAGALEQLICGPAKPDMAGKG
jgi:hypothetical protein